MSKFGSIIEWPGVGLVEKPLSIFRFGVIFSLSFTHRPVIQTGTFRFGDRIGPLFSG